MLHQNLNKSKGDERLLINSLRLLFIISALLCAVIALSYFDKIKSHDHYAIDHKINVNVATIATLDLLPGIGLKTATKIVEYRELYPNKKKIFDKPSDLAKINGLGEAKIKKITPFICFE